MPFNDLFKEGKTRTTIPFHIDLEALSVLDKISKNQLSLDFATGIINDGMKYRSTVTLTWDFDSDLSSEEALVFAKRQIESVAQGITNARTGVRVDRLKEKVHKVRLGEFKPEDVIPYITKDETKREYEYEGVTHAVKMNSHRYFLFRECMKCVSCDLPGTKMLLEHHPADKSPHFNLYGEEDGKLVLMTKDHIHPKSCGGDDRHSNYALLCIICNNLKGNANISTESIFELRKIYNEFKDKLPKKQIYKLIEERKQGLQKPKINRQEIIVKKIQNMSSDSIATVADLNIFRQGDKLFCRHVYDSIDNSRIGCMRKNTCLEPSVTVSNVAYCDIGLEKLLSIESNFFVTKSKFLAGIFQTNSHKA